MAKTPRATGSVPIGSFCESLLTESQFQALNGTGWVLADGRSVVGTTYANVTGNVTVPDARGLVLRGKNNGRADGKQNPDGESVLGTYQADSVQSHNHNYRSSPSPAGGGQYGYSEGASNIYGDNKYGAIATTGNVGNFSTETRMKNVTVNIFIRVN